MIVGRAQGDNMGAALGLGLPWRRRGVARGRRGTVFARHTEAGVDASGALQSFADAEGLHPLLYTLNAARVLNAGAAMLGDYAEFDRFALAAAPGAGGLTLIPHLDGRTRTFRSATGTLLGLTLRQRHARESRPRTMSRACCSTSSPE